MNIIKTFIFLALVCFSVSAAAYDCSAPDKFAKSVSDEVVKILQTEKSDAAKTKKLEHMFVSIVDTAWMGRFALGKHFREASAADIAKYSAAYKQYLVNSYVPSFKKYNGEKVSITAVNQSGKDQIVMTQIERNTGAPVLINYRVSRNGGCFKVRDIVAEGVSLINTQRQDFDSVISSKGMDELINLLKSKDYADATQPK